MGATSSQPAQQGQSIQPNSKKGESIIISNQVVQNLSKMSGVFEHQKNNNLYDLRRFVISMINKDPELKRTLEPLLPQIDTYIQRFDTIFTQNGSKHNTKMNAKNEDLFKYLSTYQDDKLLEVKKDLEKVSSNLFEGETAKDVDSIMTNLVNMNTKARFYEYKYIGLNIFMISLLHSLYGSVLRFINDIDEYNNIRMQQQKEIAKHFVEKVKEVVSQNIDLNANGNMDLRYKEISDLDELTESTMKNIDYLGKQIQDRGQEQVRTMKDILNTLSKYEKISTPPQNASRRNNQRNSPAEQFENFDDILNADDN